MATIAAGVFVLSGYVVNVWLGRLLGPEDYGRFGVVIGLMTLLNVIQNAAIPQAVARTAAQSPELAEGTLRRGAELQMSLAIAMAAVLIAAATAIADVLGDRSLAGLIWIAALALPPYGLFTLFMAYHNGRRQYTRQALTQAAYALAKVAGAILLAYALRLTGALTGYVFAALVGVAVGWHRISAARAPVPYRRLLGFAGPLSVFAVATVGLMSVDLFFVKALVPSDEAAGYYAAGQNVARIPYYLLTGLAGIILPAVAAAVQLQGAAATRRASQALRWALIIVMPVVAITLTTSTSLVELLYSPEYGPAGNVLALLAPAMGALAVTSIVSGVLSGMGKPAVPALASVLGLAVTIAGCIALVPVNGPGGAALATLIGSSVVLLTVVVALWWSAPQALPAASALRASGVAAAAGGLAWLLSPDTAALIACYAGLFFFVAALLLATGELTIGELRRLIAGARPQRTAD